MSNKLPPRLYYTLAQAAKELGCEVDYLIHLGAIGQILLMQYVCEEAYAYPSMSFVDHTSVSESEEANQLLKDLREESHYLADGCFLVLPTHALMDLELTGDLGFGFCQDVIFINPHDYGLRYASGYYEGMADRIREKTGEAVSFYGLYFNEVIDTGEWPEKGDRCFFSIDPEKLFVLHSELERLQQGGPRSPSREVPPDMPEQENRPPGRKSVNAYLRTIAALSEALIKKPLTQPHKDAGIILEAINREGIESPILEDALARYLKDAGPAAKKLKK